MARTKLMINEWGNEYKAQTIDLKGVHVKIRAKRKPIMKLEKFHKMKS